MELGEGVALWVVSFGGDELEEPAGESLVVGDDCALAATQASRRLLTCEGGGAPSLQLGIYI